MKNIIVVGGSKYQFPLIEAAQALKLNVFCIDGNENCYCSDMPGVKFIHSDISDVALCKKYLQGITYENAVTAQSDVGVILVEELKKSIGRFDENSKAAKIFTYKSNFRAYLSKNDLTRFEHLIISKDEFTDGDFLKSQIIKFPVAVKPSDSSGSRGVSKVSDANNLKAAIDNAFCYSKVGLVVIEPWFSGEEFGVQVIVNNYGECKFVHHKDFLFLNIPVAHVEREKNLEIEKKLKFIIADLGIKNSILNVDAIFNSKDVEIIEIGLRLGATDIFQLVNEKYSIDIFRHIVLGDYSFISKGTSTTIFGIMYNPTEKTYLKRMKCDLVEIKIGSQVVLFKIDEEALVIEPMRNGTHRFGSFAMENCDIDIDQIMNKILDLLCSKGILEVKNAC